MPPESPRSVPSPFLTLGMAPVIAPPPWTHADPAADIFYQIMPIAWRAPALAPSGPSAVPVGTLRGLIEGLDYLADLGVSAVWMTPPWCSRAYHGYQHQYRAIDAVDPRLGTDADLRAAARACHARGIKLLADLVAYGVSTDDPAFRASYCDPSHPAGPQFAYLDRARTAYVGHTFTTSIGHAVGIVHFDLRHPAARARILEFAQRWIEPSAPGPAEQNADYSSALDGFRLDHVWPRYAPTHPPIVGAARLSGVALDRDFDGFGYHGDFWRDWRTQLAAVNPALFTLAEPADWSTSGATLYPAHDATITKPLLFAARAALREEAVAPFIAALASLLSPAPEAAGSSVSNDGSPHPSHVPLSAPHPVHRRAVVTFGDHDVDRLANAIGADAPGRSGRAHAAAALLLLQPFPPCIYAGDELGMRGTKIELGSDASDLPLRAPMLWSDDPAAPGMSRYWELARVPGDGLRRIRTSVPFEPGLCVAAQQSSPGSLLSTYRAFIRLRRTIPLLHYGDYLPLPQSDAAVWAALRFPPRHAVSVPSEFLVTAVNLAGRPAQLTLATAALRCLPRSAAHRWSLQPVATPSSPAPPSSAGLLTSGTPVKIDLSPYGAFLARAVRL